MKMRIAQVLLPACLLCGSLATLTSRAAEGIGPPAVVCFGDSITKRGYPSELEKLLGVSVEGAGVAGHNTRAGLRRLESEVLDRAPQVVVIFFGTNDSRVDSKRVHVPVAEYEANLTTMVRRCQEQRIRPVLCTPPPIDPETYFERHDAELFGGAAGLAELLQAYRGAALSVAAEHDVPAIDLQRLLADQPAWRHRDGVHPSGEGNRIIAQLVAATVEEFVESDRVGSAPGWDAPFTTLPAARAALADLPVPDGADVVVYGGTSAGVVAAVQVARMGHSVVLIEPSQHVGGMTSGGLGNTDVGKPETISGIAREVYQDIHTWYLDPARWKYETRREFVEKANGKRIASDALFVFEPHVAELALNCLLIEAGVPTVLGERLDLNGGVVKRGSSIVSIRMESGRVFGGKAYLDCSYEGDLMAEAGVAYTVGREPNAQYGEFFNGVQTKEPARGVGGLDPYRVPGDPKSGVIPQLMADVVGRDGDGDSRVQAYNYRLCLTKVPENRVPFHKPAGYDEREFELLFRWLEAGNTRGLPVGLNPIPNGKTDSNKAGWVSTDYIGEADDYPDGDHAERQRITDKHVRYTKGFLWTLANHPRVPAAVRRRASAWGYAKDEFQDNHHFPFQLYVREARRMIGRMVMTEHELKKRRPVEDPVALGSYGMDSHPTQLWVDADGKLHADTPPWTGVGPYGVSYRALTPRSEECTNLLVPVCVSASHSAIGSLRMEPVYMMLGQSAATAAVLAIEGEVAVQEVPYGELRERLLEDGQLLDAKAKR